MKNKDKENLRSAIISSTRAKKILRKGGQGFLAYLINKPQDKLKLEDVKVVNEFPEVFPEELNSLPPDREIEFVIETYPEAKPFSKTPYRMAPAELKELKEQLQELLKKEFIRPSTYLGVQQYYLLRKKMEH